MRWFSGFPERVEAAWQAAEWARGAGPGGAQDLDFLVALARGHVAAKLADRGFTTWTATGDSSPADVWGARVSGGVLHLALVHVKVLSGGPRATATDERDVDTLMRLVNMAWATFRGPGGVAADLRAMPRVFSAGEADIRVSFDGVAFRPAVTRGRYVGVRHSGTLRASWSEREPALEALHRLS